MSMQQYSKEVGIKKIKNYLTTFFLFLSIILCHLTFLFEGEEREEGG
jgi:hypothetical protein